MEFVAKNRRRRLCAQGFTACLLITAGAVSGGCNQSSPAADAANDKRWQKFQEGNKRDVGVGMSAYEKRQAQLAAKKKAEAGKTTDPPASPAPAKP